MQPKQRRISQLKAKPKPKPQPPVEALIDDEPEPYEDAVPEYNTESDLYAWLAHRPPPDIVHDTPAPSHVHNPEEQAGQTGELVEEDCPPQVIRELQHLRVFPALLTSGQLGQFLGVTRSTIWRWRITGFLPKPTQTAIGFFWSRQDIAEWLQAGKPWAYPKLRTTAQEHARAHRYSLSDYVAPVPRTEETPLETAGVDQLEAEINANPLYVDEDGVDALLDRLRDEDW